MSAGSRWRRSNKATSLELSDKPKAVISSPQSRGREETLKQRQSDGPLLRHVSGQREREETQRKTFNSRREYLCRLSARTAVNDTEAKWRSAVWYKWGNRQRENSWLNKNSQMKSWGKSWISLTTHWNKLNSLKSTQLLLKAEFILNMTEIQNHCFCHETHCYEITAFRHKSISKRSQKDSRHTSNL